MQFAAHQLREGSQSLVHSVGPVQGCATIHTEGSQDTYVVVRYNPSFEPK